MNYEIMEWNLLQRNIIESNCRFFFIHKIIAQIIFISLNRKRKKNEKYFNKNGEKKWINNEQMNIIPISTASILSMCLIYLVNMSYKVFNTLF